MTAKEIKTITIVNNINPSIKTPSIDKHNYIKKFF